MATSQAVASRSKHHGAAPPPRLMPSRARDALVFAAGVAAAVLALLASTSVLAPGSSGIPMVAFPAPGPENPLHTFYDDPELSYEIDGRRITGWDAKRLAWLRSRGLRRTPERVVMVSGSQPEPCPGEAGDHLLLRFLRNKLDYSRLHGIKLLYNRDVLHPSMTGAWAKIPIVRAAMLAHPDAEWIWWVDSDAVLTDMDFSVPLATKYAGKNFVAYGWPDKIARRSWLSINAGVFLVRNCQWSIDFLDQWARMGPSYPEHSHWGEVVRDKLADKGNDAWCDDQSALVYLLLLSNWEKRGDKAFVETEYFLMAYWKDVVGKLDGVAARYAAVESASSNKVLRRRHAEREHARYAEAWNAAVGAKQGGVPGPAGGGEEGWRRPLITHFVGCQPCSGGRNPMYSRESCDEGMRRALAFADDQVLRAYGFRHAAPLNESILPLPFDYPAAHAR